ncbi:DUF4365 domain-containing protein [Pantoea anthophila]|uniref:DUF4365 domain-containing protein n=1 Tax=Pantoea anthophila TaxID=470931 RepID=UPI00289916A2|nr:DUF4365 domain-containing protein [Pantoea anthophila]
MNAGEIGDRAGRIFQYNIPDNWIYRTQEDQNDHGIDAEIELKDSSGKALGKESTFKLQLKGELNTTKIKKGKFISYTLKTDRLKYYLSFKIPVILVVVDITTETIYWLSITNNKHLIKEIDENNNASVNIHIPIKNSLERRKPEAFEVLLKAVASSWNFLSIKGLKDAVENYENLSTEDISEVIDDVGDALYKAYHQQLHDLSLNRKFDEVYITASKLVQSEIVPIKDRFVATLYYDQAFTKSPYTKVVKDVIKQKYDICFTLINFAKIDKIQAHRFISISKARIALFRNTNEQLFPLHHINNNPNISPGFGRYIAYTTSDSLYRECCRQLEKIIRLFARIVKKGQLHVLVSEFSTLLIPLTIFKDIHKNRGSNESISFLNNWINNVFALCLNYCCIAQEEGYALELYLLNIKATTSNRNVYRQVIVENFDDVSGKLDEIDNSRPDFDKIENIRSLTIDDQKQYFISMAKSLHMDPDDPENELGQIVHRAMVNYDPSEIVKDCENLLVHYRPGGVVAEMLSLHSAGGMHLIFCSKHKYIAGTGNILSERYNCASEHDYMKGFKQLYCDSCPDKKPRGSDWKWDLEWQFSQAEDNRDFLEKIRF